mmetsp:Transcript_4428/g.10835  ORF Transcript_4428/g.10835 Transcript_4428/m.10835 type:complete len:231 (-) Transcript_4428:67-759(-)
MMIIRRSGRELSNSCGPLETQDLRGAQHLALLRLHLGQHGPKLLILRRFAVEDTKALFQGLAQRPPAGLFVPLPRIRELLQLLLERMLHLVALLHAAQQPVLQLQVLLLLFHHLDHASDLAAPFPLFVFPVAARARALGTILEVLDFLPHVDEVLLVGPHLPVHGLVEHVAGLLHLLFVQRAERLPRVCCYCVHRFLGQLVRRGAAQALLLLQKPREVLRHLSAELFVVE